MPYQLNTRDRVDDLVLAAIHLVETQGVQALTLRKLAGTLRLSPSTLVSHLDNKHRVLDLVTKRIGDSLVLSVDRTSVGQAIDGAIPDDELLPVVRAWLGLCELARADADQHAAVARIQADLRHVLGRTACLASDDDIGRDALVALVQGLWVARCSRSAPLSAARARDALRHVCVALGADAAPEPDAA